MIDDDVARLLEEADSILRVAAAWQELTAAKESGDKQRIKAAKVELVAARRHARELRDGPHNPGDMTVRMGGALGISHPPQHPPSITN